MSDSGRAPIEVDFAARLTLAKHHTGLTGEALGAKVGITGQQVYNYEHGRRIPPIGRADQLAVALGYTGLGQFLTACGTCMGHHKPGWTCQACGGGQP